MANARETQRREEQTSPASFLAADWSGEMIHAKHVEKQNTDDLWRAYKLGRHRPARDALITKYAPLVKYVAGRVAVNLMKAIL